MLSEAPVILSMAGSASKGGSTCERGSASEGGISLQMVGGSASEGEGVCRCRGICISRGGVCPAVPGTDI